MWIVCTIGFFSVCSHPEHEHFVVVDSAQRIDLERLAERLRIMKAYEAKIIHQRGRTAWPWRMALPRPIWERLCTSLAHTVNYRDLQERVALQEDLDREIVYHDIHAKLAEYAKDPEARERNE